MYYGRLPKLGDLCNFLLSNNKLGSNYTSYKMHLPCFFSKRLTQHTVFMPS